MAACCGCMLWIMHVHSMVLTAAGGAVEPCCATAVSPRMTGVSVRACFGSHGVAVAGQRPTTAGQLQQRLCGAQQLEVDCDRGCVRRLRASGGSSTAAAAAWGSAAEVRLLQRRRGGQKRQSGCCGGGVGASSGSPAAAAGASSGRPAAAEAARAPVAHTRLLQQWCGGQCCLCRSSSDVVLVHAILLVPCIMVLALLLVLEMPLGGFLQGWSQG